MSPGQIMDEVLGYARDTGGGKMMGNLGRTMQDNPAPLLLIGAGVAWMMAAGKPYREQEPWHHREERRASPDRSYQESPGWADTAASVGKSARQAGEQAAEKIAGMASAAADAAGNLRDSAASTMQDWRDSASQAGGAAYRKSRDAGANIANILNEQPFVLGALGVAFGAALGAALPDTEAEDKLMGEASDALKEQAAKGYEKAKSVAQRTFDKAADEARAQGLSTGKAEDLVGDISNATERRKRDKKIYASLSRAARNLAIVAKSSPRRWRQDRSSSCVNAASMLGAPRPSPSSSRRVATALAIAKPSSWASEAPVLWNRVPLMTNVRIAGCAVPMCCAHANRARRTAPRCRRLTDQTPARERIGAERTADVLGCEPEAFPEGHERGGAIRPAWSGVDDDGCEVEQDALEHAGQQVGVDGSAARGSSGTDVAPVRAPSRPVARRGGRPSDARPNRASARRRATADEHAKPGRRRHGLVFGHVERSTIRPSYVVVATGRVHREGCPGGPVDGKELGGERNARG